MKDPVILAKSKSHKNAFATKKNTQLLVEAKDRHVAKYVEKC